MTTAAAAEISDLRQGFESQTARRSELYRLLATAFGFPSADLRKAVSAGEVRAALAETAGGLPYSLAIPFDAPALADAGTGEDTLETEYIRLFDVGAGSGPPCPLYVGNWRGDRLGVMEECLRFYDHFGLGLPEPRPELPDHLTVALEFLHYLTFRQAEALRASAPCGDYVRAQRDFLDRAVLSWFPRMTSKLSGESPPPYYVTLASLALAFFEAEKAYLADLAKTAA
ncbi:MAG: molecular chaperone TorD family protein [Deltaproteobacteria bacterium]|nr:molecular chaperone TorD family protein [Deltaproteobacteria bacterium]